MASIRHPHVTAVVDSGEDQGRPFYVMDYHCNNLGQIIGETYRTEHPSRPLPVETAVAYTDQVLLGLEALHQAGIIHRDVKPFNLLLTEDGRVVICDFGLSKLRGERFPAPSTLKVGSPFYAAPEQTRNPDKVGAAADLYAVGVTLYRMLTGRLPGARCQPARRHRAELDRPWDDFLERALAPDPVSRFPSAQAMRQSLIDMHHAWRLHWDGVCNAHLTAAEPPRPPKAPVRLRAQPLKSGPGRHPRAFGLDRLWRPRHYAQGDFTRRAQDAPLVHDPSTQLLWQQAGSMDPLDWRAAARFVAMLNETRWEGRTAWRLPTIAELVSLLRPAPAAEQLCLPSVFARRQQRLWSCDRRSFTSAWYVSLNLGFVAWQDFTCGCHVKAVCSL
jgi:serine/threonine-protein kinase